MKTWVVAVLIGLAVVGGLWFLTSRKRASGTAVRSDAGTLGAGAADGLRPPAQQSPTPGGTAQQSHISGSAPQTSLVPLPGGIFKPPGKVTK